MPVIRNSGRSSHNTHKGIDVTRFLQDWVQEQARHRGRAIAVRLREHTLSYAELNDRSTQLSHALYERGCRNGDRVCLLMPKSPQAIVALLAIYKAGCVYVPLDCESPSDRLAMIVKSSRTKLFLAAGSALARLDELRATYITENFPQVLMADDLQALDAWPRTPIKALESVSSAHILFTSGSTGVPKGVVVTHASVIAFIDWATGYFDINASDKLPGHSPLHFDLSVFDIFAAFATGAELHLVPDDLKLRPDRLAEWIRGSRLTQWFSVPAVFTYMAKFDVLDSPDFPDLRRVIWCGEVLPVPSLVYWMQHLPHARFTNLYGPTETAIASSFYTVEQCPAADAGDIPIGKPCAGEDLLILNTDLSPAPVGETGDLYISGNGLSPGYWENDQANVAAFFEQPQTGTRVYRTGDLARSDPDGNFYYVGRTDSQVKSRGYRIELGDIEAALNRIEVLRESAVVAVPSPGFDGVALCCSYVPCEGIEPTVAILKRSLGRMLPQYMIPGHWQSVASLPRNGTGKIDRQRLKLDWQDRQSSLQVRADRVRNFA